MTTRQFSNSSKAVSLTLDKDYTKSAQSRKKNILIEIYKTLRHYNPAIKLDMFVIRLATNINPGGGGRKTVNVFLCFFFYHPEVGWVFSKLNAALKAKKKKIFLGCFHRHCHIAVEVKNVKWTTTRYTTWLLFRRKAQWKSNSKVETSEAWGNFSGTYFFCPYYIDVPSIRHHLNTQETTLESPRV